MADNGGEKTEIASDKRREEFREKGDVARSRDFLSLLVLTAGLAYFAVFGRHLYQGMAGILRRFFQMSSVEELTEPTIEGLLVMSRSTLAEMAWILAPLVIAVAAVSILGNVAQVGVLISVKAIEPNLSKLNFFANFFKTFFNKQALGNLVGSLLKISVVAVVIYLTLNDEGPRIVALSTLPLGAAIGFLIDRCLEVLLNVCLALIVISIADFAWNRYVMEEKMKMTKQEVKDENKDIEGNPHVKGQMRRRAMDIANKRMMQAVPTADVVINNPTHYSVALRYRQGIDASPVVIAKGADLMALRIRRVAAAHGVPMLENKPLARGLYGAVKVGRPIPGEFFRAVAEVLAHVYRANTARRAEAARRGSARGESPTGGAPGAGARRPARRDGALLESVDA